MVWMSRKVWSACSHPFFTCHLHSLPPRRGAWDVSFLLSFCLFLLMACDIFTPAYNYLVWYFFSFFFSFRFVFAYYTNCILEERERED